MNKQGTLQKEMLPMETEEIKKYRQLFPHVKIILKD